MVIVSLTYFAILKKMATSFDMTTMTLVLAGENNCIILSADENDQNKYPLCCKAITTSDSTWENSPLFYYDRYIIFIPSQFCHVWIHKQRKKPFKTHSTRQRQRLHRCQWWSHQWLCRWGRLCRPFKCSRLHQSSGEYFPPYSSSGVEGELHWVAPNCVTPVSNPTCRVHPPQICLSLLHRGNGKRNVVWSKLRLELCEETWDHSSSNA